MDSWKRYYDRLVRNLKYSGILFAVFLLVLMIVTPPSWIMAKNPAKQTNIADSTTASARNFASRSMSPVECLSCHQVDQPDLSHPINIAPTKLLVPDNLPLDAGQITCITCHEDTVEAHGRSRQLHDNLLRGDLTGQNFCAQCHSEANGRTDYHALMLGKAHLNWSSGSSKQFTSYSPFDNETRLCIGCHDGSVGKDIGVSHPVAIPYRRTKTNLSPSASRRRLTPTAQLDSRIRLFDNQVGCGSCHSLYSTLPDKVVMENDRSQLCRSCHQGY